MDFIATGVITVNKTGSKFVPLLGNKELSIDEQVKSLDVVFDKDGFTLDMSTSKAVSPDDFKLVYIG